MSEPSNPVADEVPESLQRVLNLNFLHRSDAAIGPDVQARQVIYFIPQSATERPDHPYSYRMRAHYHPVDHIPPPSQTWTVHLRVHRPYNLAIYVVEDLSPQRGAYPLCRAPPPPHLRASSPDIGPRGADDPAVHYLNQLDTLRPGSRRREYIVHVPRLAAAEPNRTYRFFLYPWVDEIWKCRDNYQSWRFQQWVGPRGLLYRHHPRLPRGMVVAPPAAGATVAHLDGYLVGPDVLTWVNIYGRVADWIEGCVRERAEGYDCGYVEEPVDEPDSDDDDDLGILPSLLDEYRALAVENTEDREGEHHRSAAE